MKSCWIPISPDTSGKYLATPGNDYAALISVDARAPMSVLTDALTKQGFAITYAWQSGQPTRTMAIIDRWLDTLPAPAAGKVWMYLEMTFNGDVPKLIVGSYQKCVLMICGSADVSYLFESREVADNYAPCNPGESGGNCPALPPPNPGCPVPPNPWKPALIGAGAGFVLGLLVAVAVD